MTRPLAVVGLLLISGVTAPAEDAPKKDQDAILGTWVCLSGEENGVALKGSKGTRVTFTAEEMTYANEKKELTATATYKLDPGKSPKQITICVKVQIQVAGTLETVDTFVRGIYQLDKDELKVCWGPLTAEGPLPKEFKTDIGSNSRLMIYKRDK
jgi:uncharacterized protein (TIGR03067 family)